MEIRVANSSKAKSKPAYNEAIATSWYMSQGALKHHPFVNLNGNPIW